MRRLLRLLARLLLVLVVVALVIGVWYFNRPRPDDTTEDLFQGVTYIRDIRNEPRPINIHLIKIDLAAPDIAFLVTPGTPNARQTSEFLAEFDLQVAINGDFFTPGYSNTPWDYYPHSGDTVGVTGFAASHGTVYSQGRRSLPTLYISAENQIGFSPPPTGEVYNAISGSLLFIQNGAITLPRRTASYITEQHPRSAVGVDHSGRYLYLVVVDGRQPNYSEGVTIAELGAILLEYGVYFALNLDGGASSTLVVEGENGKPRTLNSPIDNRIPGRERPVANHLGVYARPE